MLPALLRANKEKNVTIITKNSELNDLKKNILGLRDKMFLLVVSYFIYNLILTLIFIFSMADYKKKTEKSINGAY